MRSIPASVSALVGTSNVKVFYLVKVAWSSGTQGYSSGPAVSFGGVSYQANRVQSVSGLETGVIDRKESNLGSPSIRFDNLSDSGSSAFPFTTLDAGEILEDRRVNIYAYFPDAGDGVELWWGYTGRPQFSPDELYMDLPCNHFWATYEMPIPSKLAEQAGFATLETNRTSERDTEEDDLAVPIVMGAAGFRIRPTIYSKRIDEQFAHINGIISGTNASLPFDASDVSKDQTFLFDNTQAEEIQFRPGGTDVVPIDLTRFPDGAAHNDVAYFYAAFRINDNIKDRLDELKPEDVRMRLVSGRKLTSTGIASENPVLILEDVLRDPNYGLGLASADFAGVSAAASYAGSRYASRFELHKRLPVAEFVQAMCAEFNGQVCFFDNKIQVSCKTGSESSVATYAGIDSGVSARKIHNDVVTTIEKSFRENVNQVEIEFRSDNRHKQRVILKDSAAQNRAGLTTKKVVKADIVSLSLYDEDEVAINGAIHLREEQNANLFITFTTPLLEGLLPAPGNVITVRSPHIWNNASNFLFRVLKQTFDTGPEPFCTFHCIVYKPSVYDDNTAGIGVDILRGGKDTSSQGRPPDVVPVSLSIVDITTNDTEGRTATIEAVCDFPAVDLAAEMATGVFREPPWSAVRFYWHYTDEAVNKARLGAETRYSGNGALHRASGRFEIDFKKSKSIRVWFVALGHNRSQSRLGYIPDVTKVTALTGNLSSTGVTANVVGTSLFTVNDLVFIEREIDKVTAKAATTLTFQTSGGNRQAQEDTVSIAHPTGTEVAVAKLSYPSLTLPLNAPRFTYPVVSGLDARQRPDGVRTRWNDVSADNRETYHLYWSNVAGANTNPALLGTSTPAWYLADPSNPPAGVFLSKNDDLSHLILQEDIGGTGVTVYARVAARNGKNNFSTTLSAIASNAAGGGGTPAPTDAPSTPSAALIVSQGVNLATSVADSLDVFRVFASQADNNKQFGQAGTSELVLVFRDEGSTKDDPVVYVIDDTTAVFADVPVVGTLGKRRIHRRNIARNLGGNAKSPVVSIPFIAGGGTTSLTGITGFVINSIVPVPNTKGRKSDLTYSWVSPTPAPLIAKVIILQQNSGAVGFTKESREGLLDEELFQVPGPHTDTVRVSHPKNDPGQWKVRLKSIDGTSIETPVFNYTSQDEDTGPPNNGTAITVTRAKLKKGRTLAVDYVVPTLQMNSYFKTTIVIHDNNSTGTGRKFYDPLTSTWVTTYPDGSTELLFNGQNIPIAKAEIYVGGRTTFFVRIGIWNRFNGGTATYSGDLTWPVALGGSEAEPAEQDTVAPGPVQFLGWNAEPGARIDVTWWEPANVISGQVKQLEGYEVTFSNAAGTVFMNPNDGTVAAESNVKIVIGKVLHYRLAVRKAKILASGQFTTLRVRIRPISILNGVRTIHTGASEITSTLNVVTGYQDVYGSRDAVKVLDVGATLVSPGNLLRVGDFQRGEGGTSTTQLDSSRWKRWSGSTFPIDPSNGSPINTTTSNGWRWDPTTHSVRGLAGTADILLGSLRKRLMPGEYYAFTMLIRAVIAYTTTLTFRFYNGGRNAFVDNMETAVSFSVTLSSVYQLVGGVFRMKTSPDLPTTGGGGDYAEHWLGIQFSTRTFDTFIDKTMMVRGQQPLLFAPRPDEQDDTNVVPVNTDMPDIVPISGVPGGWQNPGGGGVVTLL